MKLFHIAAIALLVMPGTSFARDLVFPSDVPVATITFPDDWQPQETDTGIDVTSPDDAVYFAIDVADAAQARKTVVEAQDYLRSKGVTVDAVTAKQTDGSLNGMEFKTIEFDGTDDEGAVSISMGLLMVSEKKSLVLTYWGTKGEQDKGSYTAVLDIVRTIKPAS